MNGTGCTADTHGGCLIESVSAATLQARLALAAAQVPLGPSLQLRFFVNSDTGEYVLRRPRTADALCDAFDSNTTTQSSTLGIARSLLTPWLPRDERDTAALHPYPDGQARLLIMFRAMLAQLCQESIDTSGLTETCNGYSFFASPGADTTHVATPVQAQRNKTRLAHTLRALTQGGAVCVRRCGGSSDASHDGVERDWWSTVLQSTLQALRGRGDYVELTNTHGNVRWDLVRGVLHHLLSTEVDEEEVGQKLCDLLMDYLTTGCDGTLEALRQRVLLLHEQPARVLVCSVTSDASHDAQMGIDALRSAQPPCCGPLGRSQVLPRHLCLLPTSTQGGSRSAAGLHSPLFYLHMNQYINGATCEESGAAQPLRVVLLRIDPTGDWLGVEETVYNTRTFVSYYYAREEEAETKEKTKGRRRMRLRAVDGSSDSNDEDDFAVMEAKQAGRRDVRSCSASESDVAQEQQQCETVTDEDEDEDEGLMRRFITALSCISPSSSSHSGSSNDPTMLQLRSTVRLYLWALRHRVHVILTPERAPAIMKHFGQRHLTLLRAFLTTPPHALNGATAARSAAQSSSEVNDVIISSDIHDIFLVDELRLDSFLALQRTAAELAHESTLATPPNTASTTTQSVVLLSRDRLRVASSAEEEDAIVPVTRCVVTTPMDLFRYARTVEEFLQYNRALLPCEPEVRRDKGTSRRNNNNDAVMRTAERICVLELCPLTVIAKTLTESEHKAQHVDPLDTYTAAFRHTSAPPSRILLVAPSMTQAMQYEHLLRKCAATLHALLPLRVSSSFAEDKDVCGVVRAGGAFCVALARELKMLAQELYSTRCRLVLYGMTQAACDVRMVRYVLNSLAVACMSVPNKLAEGIIEQPNDDIVNSSASNSVTGSSCSDARCVGPRARRRLWWSARAEALMSTIRTCEDADLPTLHCYQPGIRNMLHAMSAQPSSTIATSTLSDAALARRVFCADVQRDVGSQPDTRMPFVESLQDNVRLVFDVLDALRHITCVAV